LREKERERNISKINKQKALLIFGQSYQFGAERIKPRKNEREKKNIKKMLKIKKGKTKKNIFFKLD